jgi:hypothetical protein
LVCTYDGTTLSFYVNGALANSVTTAYSPNNGYLLRIGAGNNDATASYFFPGRVDEVALYNTALSTTQVQTHYAAAFPANAAPRFTFQPRSRATLVAETYTFPAAVHGALPVTFQWKHAGTNLPGATTASLVLNSVKRADAGSYQLQATRGSGSASSATANLTVLPGEAVSGNLDGNNASTISGYSGRAGYVNLGNWNEMEYTSASGSAANLMNNLGRTNGMIATWGGSGYRAWSGPLQSAMGDTTLLNGFLDTTTTGSNTLTLSNIPANYQSYGYSLYVYMGAPYYAVGVLSSSDTFGAISVGTVTNFYHAIDLTLWDGSFHQATNTNPADPAPADANYMVFSNLNAASVTVLATAHPALVGPGSLSGFQLVANVPPAPVPLTVSRQGGSILLSWSGEWVLQSKPALDNNPNSWTDVANAASPYTVPSPLGAAKFYRLRSP